MSEIERLRAAAANARTTAKEHDAVADEHRQRALVARAKARGLESEVYALERAANALIPVDTTAVQLSGGGAVPEDGSHTELRPDGQQKGYIVLTPEERAKGFVRPVRGAYRHVGARPAHPTRELTEDEQERFGGWGYVAFEPYPPSYRGSATGRFWTKAQLEAGCGQITTMSRDLAESYARKPDMYGGTFCVGCKSHPRVGADGEFVWIEEDGSDGPRVGT